MNLTKNLNFLNFLFFLIPVAFIFRSSVINLLVIFIIISCAIKYKKEILNLSDKTLLCFLTFFIILIVSGAVEEYINPQESSFLKSILFLRYFLLAAFVSYVVKKDHLNFKYFFLSCLICTTILSLDIIYQSINGKDLFGIVTDTKYQTHNAGFFGNQLVAGSYLQRFFMLGLFAIPLLTKKIKKFNFVLLVALIIGSIGIILAGNRMPVVLFIIFLFTSIFFVKKLKYEFISMILILPVLYLIIFNINSGIQSSHKSFFVNAKYIFTNVTKELKREYPELDSNKGNIFYRQFKYKEKTGYEVYSFGSGHAVLFLTAIDTWKDRPLIGTGVKSFVYKCKTKMHLPNRACEMHPHNYYLDILNSVGFLGLIFLLLGFFFIVKKRFSLQKTINESKNYFIFNSLLLALLIEFIPFRSSGSFFTTENATFIFLLFGLIAGCKYSKN